MKLSDYLEFLDASERQAFADRAGTTVDYLQQLKGGHRKPSVELSRRFVSASNGKLKLHELRPDIWAPKESAA